MDKKEKLIPFTKELLLKVEQYRQARTNSNINEGAAVVSMSFRAAVVELISKGLNAVEKEAE